MAFGVCALSPLCSIGRILTILTLDLKSLQLGGIVINYGFLRNSEHVSLLLNALYTSPDIIFIEWTSQTLLDTNQVTL